jgi:hypothetical protein
VITSLIASRAEFENWSDIVERVTGEIAAPGDHCQKREQCIPDKEEDVKEDFNASDQLSAISSIRRPGSPLRIRVSSMRCNRS